MRYHIVAPKNNTERKSNFIKCIVEGFDILIAIFAFVFGAVFASFGGVIAYRAPKGLSIVKPDSYCPSCKKPIKGYDNIPVCMAKTPYALNDGSEDKNTVHIQDIALSAGAGFAVILTGDIMTMPGLPKVPQANKIDFDGNAVTGLI